MNATEKNRRLLEKLTEAWQYEKEYQAVNRNQQAIDDDFYDGEQWSAEDIEVLNERGQPALVYNLVKQAVNWVLGTEKRNRIDFNVYPRTKDGNKTAQVKKQLLKFISDANKLTFARSLAFEDAVKVGVGWLEDSIRGDDSKELLQSSYVSWRNVWYDSLSIKADLSDARHLFRSFYVDLDVAQNMFPNHAKALKHHVTSDDYTDERLDEDDYLYGNQYQNSQNGQNGQGVTLSRRTYSNGSYLRNSRKRIRLVECWYREPITTQKMRGGMYSGEDYDKSNTDHVKQVQEQFATLTDALVMQMHCAIFCESILLQSKPSPYKHNDFPFTPVWGYRRGKDNAPYGMIRELRDPQESLNKRNSKAVHILSTNTIIADESAATDWDDVREQAARPDGIILLDGAQQNARFELNKDKQLAQQHVDLMMNDERLINTVSGVTDANLGKQSRAISGKAMDSQEEQGSIATTKFFDNLRFAVQLQGEKQLALTEQFYDEEKIIRITGDKGAVNFEPINSPEWDEQSQTWVMLNPMQAEKAEFVVDEQNAQANLRAAMFETMTGVLQTLPPEVALQLLDLVYDNSDLPNRDEMVKRIREINGQKDPNAEKTPESMAAEQAQTEQVQAQQQQVEEMQKLEIEKLRVEIEQLKSNITVKNVEGLYSAINAAKEVAMLPAIAPMADEVYKSAGGQDYNGFPIIDNPQALPVPPYEQNTHPQYPSNPQVGMMTGIDS